MNVPPRIGILAPMPSELRPVVRAMSLRRSPANGMYEGVAGSARIVATGTGIGTERAARATERLLASTEVDHVVVVGIAGGLPPDIGIGDLVVPTAVLDGVTGDEYRPAPLGDVGARGKLSTSDELVVDPEELARLVDQGVIALDMETAAVARVCERHERRWSVFRAISDKPSDGSLEAVMDLAHPDGSPNLPAAARYVATHPWEIKRLAKLARDSRLAAENAASAAARACASLGA